MIKSQTSSKTLMAMTSPLSAGSLQPPTAIAHPSKRPISMAKSSSSNSTKSSKAEGSANQSLRSWLAKKESPSPTPPFLRTMPSPSSVSNQHSPHPPPHSNSPTGISKAIKTQKSSKTLMAMTSIHSKTFRSIFSNPKSIHNTHTTKSPALSRAFIHQWSQGDSNS